MIVNLWSTPRTGSNWYCAYLEKEYFDKYSKKLTRLNNCLNQFHLTGYINLESAGDFEYQYQDGFSYTDYYYDHLAKSIKSKRVYKERYRNISDQETHIIELLKKHDKSKNPLLIHSHVKTTSQRAFDFLYNLADKNVFIHRKNHIDQLSSYALAFHMKNFHSRKPMLSDVEIDPELLTNLTERIIHWYDIPKKGCEVVCYEDLDFDRYDLLKKQTTGNTFDQLSTVTQKLIIECDKKIEDFLSNL